MSLGEAAVTVDEARRTVALYDRLVAEWDTSAVQVVEKGSAACIEVYVVWAGWEGVPRGMRYEVVVDAFADMYPEVVPNLVAAHGFTPSEYAANRSLTL